MQIWDSVPKPQAHKETPLSDFFNVSLLDLEKSFVSFFFC